MPKSPPDQPDKVEGVFPDLHPDGLPVIMAVGTLVVKLSYIHFVLETNLWSLLRIDPDDGRVLTQDLPFASLIAWFKSTLKLKNPSPKLLNRFNKALDQLDKINIERNRIVHGFWTFPKDGSPLIIPKKGPVTQEIAPTVIQILEQIEGAEKFLNEFFACMNQFHNPHLENLRISDSAP
ncbi:MAG: hypothetical protein CV088_12575 [Nitrospira sp. LK70]|nr:hypothetical protein [Nitrospira sp. LK70]